MMLCDRSKAKVKGCALGFLLILMVSINSFVGLKSLREASRETNLYNDKEQALGDGCYHVFLDVGANIGVHSRFLREPHLYPKAWRAFEIFDGNYGKTRDNRDFCTFAFEPNPAHASKLQATVDAYVAQGWRHYAMNVGVSDRDETMVFYRNDNGQNSDWGFSLKKLEDNEGNVEKVVVPVIRLANWIKTHIQKRRIPSSPYGDYTGGPKVVVKIDVESAEYLVLPDLIASGASCSIDTIFGEFHSRFAPLHFPGLRVNLESFEKVQRFGDSIKQIMHASRNCNVTFLDVDDESYLMDGMPLPV